VTIDTWPAVELGDVLTLALTPQQIEPQKTYPTLGVYGFGRGVITNKPAVNGHEIAASTLFRVEAGQFIYSKLKAFEGAFAVVPEEADGRFVTNEFPTFSCRDDRLCAQYLGWLFRWSDTWAKVSVESTGIGARRERLHPTDLLKFRISLPSLNVQRQIVEQLEGVSRRLKSRAEAAEQQEAELAAMLRASFSQISATAPRAALRDVAPLVRRPVSITPSSTYEAVGARAFGRGLFTKPDVQGAELTWQKLFRIECGDLVISNIKAWEGAFAVAGPEHHNKVASHRYLTCVSDPARITANCLHFYLQSPEGIGQIQAASPGSADRNRTLAQDRLEAITVPIPSLNAQNWFNNLHDKVTALRTHQAAIAADTDALLPAMLHQIFN
jgi:type I restriction enzyme S subunit